MYDTLSLFSGIGGIDLGLERSGHYRTVAFCEIDAPARRVLAKHWPTVRQYHDVRELTADRLKSDGIIPRFVAAGFPCQDISASGPGGGLNGARSGLFYEVARLIGELRPEGVLLENSSLLTRRGLDAVLGALAALGYDAEWHCIPACFVGAWHKRDRIWILAYPDAKRLQGRGAEPILRQHHLSQQPAGSFAQWRGRPRLSKSRLVGSLHGLPAGVDRVKQLGNAVVPQIPEIIGRAFAEAFQ